MLAARPQFADRIACSSRGDVSRERGTFVQARKLQFTAAGTCFELESSFGNATVQTSLWVHSISTICWQYLRCCWAARQPVTRGGGHLRACRLRGPRLK